jgi:hypothetical protein
MQQSTSGYYCIIYSLTTVYGMATFQQKKRPHVMREKYVSSLPEIFPGVLVPPIVKGVGKRHNCRENYAENEL